MYEINGLAEISYPKHNFVSNYSVQAEAITRDWIDDYTCLTPEFRRKAKLANYGVLTAEIMPLADLHIILPVARWMLWAFVWDDYYAPVQKDKLKMICKKAIAILKGQAPQAGDNELLFQLSVIRQELNAIGTPAWINRFIKSHVYYFSGLLMDIYSFGTKVKYPTTKDYLKVRDRLIGGHMVCDLLELAGKQTFTEEIYLHPDIQRLRLVATRLMIWDNDLFSYKKELQEGEAMNYVLVLREERGMSIEEALQHTIKIRESYCQELLSFEAKKANFGRYSTQVYEYWRNILILLRGQLDWYQEKSKRYS